MEIERTATRNVIASALLGAASGILSLVGIATVLDATSSSQRPDFARSPWLRRAIVTSAAGEKFANAFVASLPSRSSPGPLAGRIAFGAGSAALFASSVRRQVVIASVVGGATAAISAKAAYETRAVLMKRIPDPVVGLAENAVAAGFAWTATSLQ